MFTLIQNLLSVLQLQVHRSPDSDCIIDSCGTVSQRLQQHLGQVVREAQALTRRRHLERYHCMFILKWAIPGLFFYIFLLFNPVESKHWSIYFFLMTGFEPSTIELFSWTIWWLVSVQVVGNLFLKLQNFKDSSRGTITKFVDNLQLLRAFISFYHLKSSILSHCKWCKCRLD